MCSALSKRRKQSGDSDQASYDGEQEVLDQLTWRRSRIVQTIHHTLFIRHAVRTARKAKTGEPAKAPHPFFNVSASLGRELYSPPHYQKGLVRRGALRAHTCALSRRTCSRALLLSRARARPLAAHPCRGEAPQGSLCEEMCDGEPCVVR